MGEIKISVNSDEARRAVRQRRILQNAEKRMNIILGTDSDEKGHEPDLEDEEVRKLPNKEQNIFDTPPKDDHEQIDKSCIDNTPKCDVNHSASPVSHQTSIDTPHSFQMPKQTPQVAFYRKPRVNAAALFGFVFGLIIAFGLIDCNILIPWILYQTTLEIGIYFNDPQSHHYPDHGHLVNILLFYGFKEHIVMLGGRLADIGTRVMDDSVISFICFLMIHMIVS